MKTQSTLFAVLCLILIGASGSETTTDKKTKKNNMEQVSLGYVILYVKNVETSLSFYEKAFGLKRRFYSNEDGKAYGELETGAARLAFASISLAEENIKEKVATSIDAGKPLAFEVALVTKDVEGLFKTAVKAGAKPVMKPTKKPWGQTVAYLKDCDGNLVELCTPLP